MSKNKGIQIVSAPSILGLKPSGVEKLPEALLSHGLSKALNAVNNVEIPTYNHTYSFERNALTHILNGDYLRKFSLELNAVMENYFSSDPFVLVLGGDCSILIGITSALKLHGSFGLFFFDAHADFYEPERSLTGEVADMELGFVTGRGPGMLSNINSAGPYIQDQHVIHIGQRDMEETEKYKSRDIRATAMKCFDLAFIEQYGVEQTWVEINAYVSQLALDGFWIHFDTDVLSDSINPAVDYRLAGGLTFAQCEFLLKKMMMRYRIKGMTVTIFNPSLDHEQKIAAQLTKFFASVLR